MPKDKKSLDKTKKTAATKSLKEKRAEKAAKRKAKKNAG